VPRGPDRAVSLVDVLEVMVSSSDPAFSTTEIADELDTTTQTIRKRVEELADRGFVTLKETPNAKIFWITDAGYQHYVDSR